MVACIWGAPWGGGGSEGAEAELALSVVGSEQVRAEPRRASCLNWPGSSEGGSGAPGPLETHVVQRVGSRCGHLAVAC